MVSFLLESLRAMYDRHFGLSETPFANTLDPHWFYASPGHDEAVARLLYLVEQQRRCGVIVGPPGTGKSLVLRVLVAQARRAPCDVVLVDLLGRNARELLWETVAALGLGPRGDESPRILWRILSDYLETNRFIHHPIVLCYDHLDRAEHDCLAAVERIYHANTDGQAGVTLLVGTRRDRLPRLTQILTEIADLHVEIAPLDRAQTEAYVLALAARAGAMHDLFDPELFDRIHAETRGVPRDISRLCDLALVIAMSEGASSVTAPIIEAAAEQLHPLRYATAPIFQTRSRAIAGL
jgi:general secretion pathway protein A